MIHKAVACDTLSSLHYTLLANSVYHLFALEPGKLLFRYERCPFSYLNPFALISLLQELI